MTQMNHNYFLLDIALQHKWYAGFVIFPHAFCCGASFESQNIRYPTLLSESGMKR